MPIEVRTKRGSSKCLRSLARAMLTVDWLSESFCAAADTLLVRLSSPIRETSLRSMFFSMRHPGRPPAVHSIRAPTKCMHQIGSLSHMLSEACSECMQYSLFRHQISDAASRRHTVD